MRMLTIIGGVLMLLTGIFCFINPGQTFLAIAFVIGLVMVLNGLIHICAYMMGRGLNNKGDNNGWILTDALITLLLGILCFAISWLRTRRSRWCLACGCWYPAYCVSRRPLISTWRESGKTFVHYDHWRHDVVVGLFGFINPLVMFLSTVVLRDFSWLIREQYH